MLVNKFEIFWKVFLGGPKKEYLQCYGSLKFESFITSFKMHFEVLEVLLVTIKLVINAMFWKSLIRSHSYKLCYANVKCDNLTGSRDVKWVLGSRALGLKVSFRLVISIFRWLKETQLYLAPSHTTYVIHL